MNGRCNIFWFFVIYLINKNQSIISMFGNIFYTHTSMHSNKFQTTDLLIKILSKTLDPAGGGGWGGGGGVQCGDVLHGYIVPLLE